LEKISERDKGEGYLITEHLIDIRNIITTSIALLFIFSASCTSKSVTDKDIQQAKELSLEGMKIVENWIGKGEDIEKAYHLFNEAISLNPKSIEAYTGLGRVTLRKGFISGFKYERNALETALGYADHAISIDANYARAHKLRGRILTLMAKYEEAFKEAEILEKLDPSSCEHINLRAGIYEVSSNIDEAIAERIKELSCEPATKASGIYDSLGELYFKKKDYNNASLYYKKEIEMSPESAWAYGNYSRVLTAMGKLDEAEKTVRKALSIMDYGMAHVYLSRIYLKRGEIYETQGKLYKAENEYLRAAAEYPEDKNAYYKLAYIYGRNGNCIKAIKASNDILSIDPKDEYAKKTIEHCGNKLEEKK
jgi:tetratricopeptide (TPR) repeat protein